MDRRLRRNIMSRLVALIVCDSLVGLTPTSATTDHIKCTLGDLSAANVTIESCLFNHTDVSAGNTTYDSVLELSYSASREVDAVRFCIDAGNGARYEIVDRQHVDAGQIVKRTFRLISPTSTVARVAVCPVGPTTQRSATELRRVPSR